MRFEGKLRGTKHYLSTSNVPQTNLKNCCYCVHHSVTTRILINIFSVMNHLCDLYDTHVGQDSSVVIATRYALRDPGIESRRCARFSAHPYTSPGAHPAAYTMGTRCLSPHLAPRLKKVELYLYLYTIPIKQQNQHYRM
jgi:hypothetical protein